MLRDIINIDEDKCNGCGLCIPGCPEGALQIIDGKARLVSELSCDGLGACIGDCPEGALKVEKKDVPPYDERVVMSNIVKQGENTILAHLRHLKEHNEVEYFNIALDYLVEMGVENPLKKNLKLTPKKSRGCIGTKEITRKVVTSSNESGTRDSKLRQWPVQLKLVKADAAFFKKSDLLLAADCVPFAVADFHKEYLDGKSLAIACPKLDDSQENYINKLVDIIELSHINTLTVMIIEVPCCQGLLKTAQIAVERVNRKIPIKLINVSRDGNINSVNWL